MPVWSMVRLRTSSHMIIADQWPRCSSCFILPKSWAPAIAMIAVYAIFFAEIAAFRIGSQKMAKLGLTYSKFALSASHLRPFPSCS
jgi:hypothetical protein